MKNFQITEAKLNIAVILAILLAGCVTPSGSRENRVAFHAPGMEMNWIRAGDPIEFEDGLWYPSDDVEILLDSEVLLAGQYRGVEFFIEKKDIRPFSRLYTKFDEHKFRVFEQKSPDGL